MDAQFSGALEGSGVVLAADDDYGDFLAGGFFSEEEEEGQAVHGGDGDVEEDQVGVAVEGGGHGHDGVFGADDLVAFHLEEAGEGLAGGGVVINDEDGGHIGGILACIVLRRKGENPALLYPRSGLASINAPGPLWRQLPPVGNMDLACDLGDRALSFRHHAG